MSFPFLDALAVHHSVKHPDQPTLIFLHDSLGCIELWRDFPERLAALTHCNYMIYDRQGYGKSCGFSYKKRQLNYLEHEADVLQALIEKKQIKKAILFGHSDGGSIALLTAALHPDNILGIITEGAHVLVEDATLNGIHSAVHQYQSTDLKSRLEKYHGAHTDAMFRAWTQTWTAPEFKNWNIEYCLSQIQCPALIIQGEDDEFGTLDQVNRITHQIRNSNRLIVPKTGHNPHKESPDKVLKSCADFMAQLITSSSQ